MRALVTSVKADPQTTTHITSNRANTECETNKGTSAVSTICPVRIKGRVLNQAKAACVMKQRAQIIVRGKLLH